MTSINVVAVVKQVVAIPVSVSRGVKGDKGDPGATGADGLQGPKGDKGDKGDTGERGAEGLQGPKGDQGDPGEPGSPGTDGLQGPKGDRGDPGADGAPGIDGDNGWSPMLGIAEDGDRRVFQVTDWTGGTGVKPAVGRYVGTSGLVDAIVDAIDIRGPTGSASGDFQAPIVAGAAYTWRSQDFGNEDNPGSNVLMTVPFWCGHTITWNKIGIVVTAGDSGGVVRLGVYASNEYNRPGNLLLDAGEVDVSTDGFKEIDISLRIEANTVVWLATLCNANPDNLATYVAAPFADAQDLAILGLFLDDPLLSAGFARAQSYGPLPATCGPGDGDSGRYPLPYLRTGV